MVAALSDTVERLRRLLGSGYSVELIESDHGAVTATLRRAGDIVTLRLPPSEAERLLYGPPLR